MAVAKVGASGTTFLATTGGSAGITGGYGQSPTTGNLLVMAVTMSMAQGNNVSTCSTPAGWTAGPTGTAATAATYKTVLNLFWKIAVGADTGPTVSTFGGSYGTGIVVEEWVGLTAAPLDVASSIGSWNAAATTSAGSVASGPVTTTNANDWIWSFAGTMVATDKPGTSWTGGSTANTHAFMGNYVGLDTAAQSVSSTGTFTPSFSWPSDTNAIYGVSVASVAFKASGAPATPNGTATGSTLWAGIALGAVLMSGAGVGAATFTGAANGTAPGIAVSQGTGAGQASWVGAATGTNPVQGASSGATAWAGIAAGSSPVQGTGTGLVSWVGAAAGSSPTQGTAAGSTSWAGAAVGSTLTQGTGTGSIAWTGTANGTAPVVGAAGGTASGATTWVGTATGATAYQGATTGTYTFVGASTGSATRAGATSGAWVFTGAATGTNTVTPQRDITVTATILPRRWAATSGSRRWEGHLL